MGQPFSYEELSIPLFMSRYLTMLETIKPAHKPLMTKHLKELMAALNKPSKETGDTSVPSKPDTCTFIAYRGVRGCSEQDEHRKELERLLLGHGEVAVRSPRAPFPMKAVCSGKN